MRKNIKENRNEIWHYVLSGSIHIKIGPISIQANNALAVVAAVIVVALVRPLI